MTENNLPVLPQPDVRFRLYGPTEVTSDGLPVDLGEPKVRALVGALALAGSKQVRREELMAWLWEEPQPEGARAEFYKVVSKTRKRLENLGFDLRRDGSLYQLEVPADRVDVHVFRRDTQQAQQLLGKDDHQAVKLLRRALELANGDLMADLEGRRIDGLRHQMNETRRLATLNMAKARLRLGQHHELIGDLTGEHIRHPGDEMIAELLMTTLHRAGRQGDAQRVYRELRRRLQETLATDNLRRLDDLYQRMLNHDPELDPPAEEPVDADAPGSAKAKDGPDEQVRRERPKTTGSEVHIEFNKKVIAPGSVFGISNTFRT